MSVRRVLMTGDTVGGVWSYALDLARGLSARGVEVLLATMGRVASATQRAEAARVAGLTLDDSAFALEWMDEPWEDVRRAGRWLLELERSFRPDVVHLNGYAHASLPFDAPVVLVGHSSVCTWWRATQGSRLPARYDRYRMEVAKGIAAAAVVVAPSLVMLRGLDRAYGPMGEGRVIPNGAWPDAYAAAPKAPLILAAGRLWDEAKNLAALADVAPELAWPIHVAGEQGEAPLPATLTSLGALSRAELASEMGRAAIFAHPARYEPFGLAPLEAAMAGCALVLSDIPSLREVWGDAAIFVSPVDRDALREALTLLIEDSGARHLWAARAREHARAFDASAMSAAYFALYRSVLDRRAEPPLRMIGAPR